VAVKDFNTKSETLSRNKKGKREYLNDVKTRDFMDQLNDFFESFVEIPRIKVGERQTIETLMNEEALLLAKYQRRNRCLGSKTPILATHYSTIYLG
jgi:hypothetical protein